MTQPGVTDWIDVSVTVRHGMPHWPDNPPIVLERVMDLRRGDDCNVSHLAMGVHSGTHMDAPVHFIHHGAGLDEMPLAATMGEARVIQIDDPREITADELRAHNVQAGERVLFRTSNSARCWQASGFVEDFVYITEPAAEHLAATRVQTGRHRRDLRSDAGRERQEGVDGGGGVRRFQVRPRPSVRPAQIRWAREGRRMACRTSGCSWARTSEAASL